MAWWLLKTEPGAYSFGDLERERVAAWTGVANPVAQKHLRSMSEGDRAVVYHTGEEKAAVGIARVVRAAYPDPTAGGRDLSCVDLAVVSALPAPVALAALKGHPAFAESPLVRQGRLSVVPLTAEQWKAIEALARRAR
jgi:predicted RNA-binding protein with PUA-like domain